MNNTNKPLTRYTDTELASEIMRRAEVRKSPTRTGHDGIGRWGKLIIVDLLTKDWQTAGEVASQTADRIAEFRSFLPEKDAAKLPDAYDDQQVRYAFRILSVKHDSSVKPWRYCLDLEKHKTK